MYLQPDVAVVNGYRGHAMKKKWEKKKKKKYYQYHY